MIQSFKDEHAAELFREGKCRRWPGIALVAGRKLDRIHAAAVLHDLRVPPGNRLEVLAGDRRGQHSIRINDQYRICFLWHEDGTHEVEIADYHKEFKEKEDMPRIKKPATGWAFQRVATHPGEVLLEEFLKPLQISQHKLAMDIHVPATRIGEIVHGRRAITPETALRLARYFGTSAEFWLNLQQNFDLAKTRTEQEGKIVREVQAFTS